MTVDIRSPPGFGLTIGAVRAESVQMETSAAEAFERVFWGYDDGRRVGVDERRPGETGSASELTGEVDGRIGEATELREVCGAEPQRLGLGARCLRRSAVGVGGADEADARHAPMQELHAVVERVSEALRVLRAEDGGCVVQRLVVDRPCRQQHGQFVYLAEIPRVDRAREHDLVVSKAAG